MQDVFKLVVLESWFESEGLLLMPGWYHFESAKFMKFNWVCQTTEYRRAVHKEYICIYIYSDSSNAIIHRR